MTPAREVYQLRVHDSGHHHLGAAAIKFLESLVVSIVSGAPETVARVELDIVDVRTNTVVKSLSEFAGPGAGLGQLIADDLDRLDADAFAREWGITT
jgi:hypothetical protein